jgi:hypothetical protein
MSKELQECSQLDDHQWNRSSDPVNFNRKGVTESANWHRQLNGKNLRLILLEVMFKVNFIVCTLLTC